MAPIADLVVLLLKSSTYAPAELRDEVRRALQPQGVQFLVQQDITGQWSGTWRGYQFRVTLQADPWLSFGGRYTWEMRQGAVLVGTGPANTLEEACAEMLILTK